MTRTRRDSKGFFDEKNSPAYSRRKLSETPKRPQEILDHLNEKVVGQKNAKQLLSVLFSMHSHWFVNPDPDNPCQNGLLVGPTGNGKTYSLKTLSKFMGIPFQIVDCTSLVPSGASNGRTIEAIIEELIAIASEEFDCSNETPIEIAGRAIVFFDEFDKLAAGSTDGNNYEWRRQVQRSFLKFLEGSKIPTSSGVIDTSGILTIAGGAFTGIGSPEITRLRSSKTRSSLANKDRSTIVTEDIINFGFMPELVARLPAIIQIDPLTVSDLENIIRRDVNSPLTAWKRYFSAMDIELVVEDSFVAEAATRASVLEMGARGLQQVVFPVLARLAFQPDLPDTDSSGAVHISSSSF